MIRNDGLLKVCFTSAQEQMKCASTDMYIYPTFGIRTDGNSRAQQQQHTSLHINLRTTKRAQFKMSGMEMHANCSLQPIYFILLLRLLEIVFSCHLHADSNLAGCPPNAELNFILSQYSTPCHMTIMLQWTTDPLYSFAVQFKQIYIYRQAASK